jgi:hypothetical protein
MVSKLMDTPLWSRLQIGIEERVSSDQTGLLLPRCFVISFRDVVPHGGESIHSDREQFIGQ